MMDVEMYKKSLWVRFCLLFFS